MATLEHDKYAVTMSCPQAATLFIASQVEMGTVY